MSLQKEIKDSSIHGKQVIPLFSAENTQYIFFFFLSFFFQKKKKTNPLYQEWGDWDYFDL